MNAGSVGLPRDGDPRACYAVIEDGEPVLKRVAYDVESAPTACGQDGLSMGQLAYTLAGDAGSERDR